MKDNKNDYCDVFLVFSITHPSSVVVEIGPNAVTLDFVQTEEKEHLFKQALASIGAPATARRGREVLVTREKARIPAILEFPSENRVPAFWLGTERFRLDPDHLPSLTRARAKTRYH